MTSSLARQPWQLSGMPRPPSSASQCLRFTMSARLFVPATARTTTSPPSPPSPPSGPPFGTYFSRRKLQQPLPPSPPLTNRVTRSTNMNGAAVLRSQPMPRQPQLYPPGRSALRPAEGSFDLVGGHVLDR